MVSFKRVLHFFDPEHTVTYFLSHQRMPVLVTQLLSVFILQPASKSSETTHWEEVTPTCARLDSELATGALGRGALCGVRFGFYIGVSIRAVVGKPCHNPMKYHFNMFFW